MLPPYGDHICCPVAASIPWMVVWLPLVPYRRLAPGRALLKVRG